MAEGIQIISLSTLHLNKYIKLAKLWEFQIKKKTEIKTGSENPKVIVIENNYQYK